MTTCLGTDRYVVALVWMSGKPVEKLGLQVAGALPSSPAREAQSVPCPFPVALRLPYKWTLNAVARLSSLSGSFERRWKKS
jgi:hypothetical protein